jgi:hypothetical protein
MFLDNRQKLQGHATGLLGSGLPLLYRGFAGIQVTSEDRLADSLPLSNPYDPRGTIILGTARQDSSKRRIVALSMVPARCIPARALWIASKAGLL